VVLLRVFESWLNWPEQAAIDEPREIFNVEPSLIEERLLFQGSTNVRTDAMRLLYLVDEWPSLFQRYLCREVQWMREHGHGVSVVSLNCAPYGYRSETQHHVDLAEFGLKDIPVLELDSQRMSMAAMAAECHSFACRQQVQFMDAHLARDPAELACQVHLASGIPYAVRMRGGDVHTRTSPRLAEFLHYASAVCPMSQFLADVLTGARILKQVPEGIPATVTPGKLHVVPGCLPESLLADAPALQSEDSQIVGAIGRAVPNKRFHDIIEAVAGLVSEFPGLKLKIIGGGWTSAELQSLASDMGITDRFVLTGFKSWADTMTLVRQFHIYVHASELEGFGLSTIEAAFHGIPLVLSRTGANEQCVEPGINGYLFDAGDVTALRECLRSILLAGAKKREHMGRGSLDIVGQKFSAERVMPLIETIYQDAIANERHAWPVSSAGRDDRVGGNLT
jgi:glycosyltransferase involved in cell wall biosynthesis